MTQRYLRMRFRLLNSIQSLVRSCFHVFSLFSSLQEVPWKFKELRRHSTGMINVPFCNWQDVGGGERPYTWHKLQYKIQDLQGEKHKVVPIYLISYTECLECCIVLSNDRDCRIQISLIDSDRPTFFSNASWLLSTFSARFCTRPVAWLQWFAWFCM